MAMTIHCDIVSAEESLYSGLVESLTAAGLEGDLGIYYGHAPLLTRLQPGPVRVALPGDKERVFFVGGGFLEVQPGTVTVLADTAVRAADLDEAAAEEARRQAAEALEDRQSELDYAVAAARLAHAVAQLRTIRQLRDRLG